MSMKNIFKDLSLSAVGNFSFPLLFQQEFDGGIKGLCLLLVAFHLGKGIHFDDGATAS